MARLKAAERRAQLLAAARSTFLKTGPDRTSIRDIAAAADVNEALIYRHFASKDELFEAAIVDPLSDLMEQLQSEARSLPPGAPELVEYTREFHASLLRIFSESFEMFGVVLFSDPTAGGQFYAERVVPFIDSIADTVRSNLDSWDHHDFDPAVTVPMSFGMCWGLAMDSHYRRTSLDVEATAEAVTSIFFHGLEAKSS